KSLMISECRAPRENLINLNSQAVLEKLSSL
ncbi:hypothetical protein, partial [Escherichia coli]